MTDRRLRTLEGRLEGADRRGWVHRIARERAAVAAILREGEEGLELLMIRRSVHPSDPWSGHVALPGGRAEPQDRDARETACRETLEEVGLDLQSARCLGHLPRQIAKTRTGIALLSIEPIVFALAGHAEEPKLTLSNEVARAFWVPLAALADTSRHGTLDWKVAVWTLKMPTWQWDGETIWGITHRIVSSLLQIAG